ncbi:hypothetical protein RhiirB3_398520 [Rhizophagus irregularis]|nr:hypothetical protein RhiirB3_398520 [Rhizophagus irregularis]
MGFRDKIFVIVIQYGKIGTTVITTENSGDGRAVVVRLALMKNSDNNDGNQDEEIGDKELFNEIESMVKESIVW